MKKIIVVVILVIAIFFVYKTIFKGEEKKKTNEFDKEWYVEITNSYINVREKPQAYANLLGAVYEGEKYEVLDMNLDDYTFVWYKIKTDDSKENWIASKRTSPYLKDNNNPNDIATPVIKLFDNIYYVDTIDDIDYKHLEVWDDRDGYEVTHKVYKEIAEYNNIQYWIVYTVKDKAGKTASKTQRIIFTKNPSDNQVLDFELLKK